MKRIHLLLSIVAFPLLASVSDASPPQGIVQESISKQTAAVQPQMTVRITPIVNQLDVVAHEFITQVLFTTTKPTPQVQSVSLNSGSVPVVSADRSVWLVTTILKPKYYKAMLPFRWIESRATDVLA